MIELQSPPPARKRRPLALEAKVAIAAAILGLSAMACVIGFLVLVWLGIKSLQPSPSRAAFEFHNKLHLDAFRQWADQQFEIAKTNRSENLTILGKAAKVPLLSGNSISFEPSTGAEDPSMWAIL